MSVRNFLLKHRHYIQYRQPTQWRPMLAVRQSVRTQIKHQRQLARAGLPIVSALPSPLALSPCVLRG